MSTYRIEGTWQNSLFANCINDTKTSVFRYRSDIFDVGRKDKVYEAFHQSFIQATLPRNVPMMLFFDTFQWLTGFLAAFSFSPLPPETFEVGCQGGMVTKMLSSGFHSLTEWAPVPGEVPLLGGDVGSWGVKAPSSRSLSYTMIVPSKWDTRKRFGDEGTQRIAVHGELHIRP